LRTCKLIDLKRIPIRNKGDYKSFAQELFEIKHLKELSYKYIQDKLHLSDQELEILKDCSIIS
jgi:hypothetical protein